MLLAGILPSKNSRRAAGEIISNIIMIMASVSLAGVAFYWGLSFQGQTQSSFGGRVYEGNLKTTEAVSIDTVYFNPTTNEVTIYVRNFSDSPLKIVSIFINDAPKNPPETTVLGRSNKGIQVTHTNWSIGDTVKIRIVTTRGTIYEKYFKTG